MLKKSFSATRAKVKSDTYCTWEVEYVGLFSALIQNCESNITFYVSIPTEFSRIHPDPMVCGGWRPAVRQYRPVGSRWKCQYASHALSRRTSPSQRIIKLVGERAVLLCGEEVDGCHDYIPFLSYEGLHRGNQSPETRSEWTFGSTSK